MTRTSAKAVSRRASCVGLGVGGLSFFFFFFLSLPFLTSLPPSFSLSHTSGTLIAATDPVTITSTRGRRATPDE